MAVHDYVENLTTERNRAWEAQKEVLDRAVAEKRELSGEEKAVIVRTDETLDGLDKEIKDWMDRDQRDKESGQARDEWAKIVRPAVDDRRHEQTEADHVRSVLRGDAKGFNIDITSAANEKRAIRAGASGAEFRDLLVGTTSAGGYTVPTDLARRLYDFMEIYSGMRQTNVTVLSTSGGNNIDLPKVTAHGTAAIVGEGTALAEADGAFNKATLGAYKYGQLLQISDELLEDTGVDIVGFIAKDMGRAIARVTDTAYVLGTGTNQPTGVVPSVGTGVGPTTGTNAAVVTFDNIIDLLYSVNQDYRNNGAQWFMKDATAGVVRKLKDSQNRYLWEPSMIAGQPDRLLNFPVVTDPNLASVGTSAKSILFGDFSAFVIRDVGGIELASSTDYAFANDLVTYRTIIRTDSKLVDLTGAIKLYAGGTA